MRPQTWRCSLRQIPQQHGPGAQQLRHSRSLRPGAASSDRAALNGQISQSRGISTAGEDGSSAQNKLHPRHEGFERSDRSITRGHSRRKESTKSNGVPPPPPIPAWFLKYNIRLQSEEHGQSTSQKSKALVLQDPYNDKVLLTIPYLEPIELNDITTSKRKQSKDNADRKAGEGQIESDFFSAQTLLSKNANGENKSSEQACLSGPVAADGKPAGADEGAKPSDTPPVDTKSRPQRLPKIPKPFDEAVWARLQGQLLIQSILEAAARPDKKNAPRNIVVFTPDHTAHDELDRFVEDAADLSEADIIRIDASDIAELAGDYIDPISSGPGSIAGLAYDAYEGGRADNFSDASDQADANNAESAASQEPQSFDLANTTANSIEDILKEGRKRLEQALSGHHVVGVSFGPGLQNLMQQRAMARAESKPESSEEVADLDRWQRMKLKIFFDDLLSSASLRRNADITSVPDNFIRQKFADLRSNIKHPDRRRELFDANEDTLQQLTQRFGRKRLARDSLRLLLAHHVETAFGNDMPAATLVEDHPNTGTQASAESSGLFASRSQATASKTSKGTIIHLRDIHLIYETPHGEELLKIISGIVRKRQQNGEPIMIIGSSAEYTADVATPLEGMEEDDFGKDQGFIRLQLNYHRQPGRTVIVQGDSSPAKGLPPGLLLPVYPVEPGYRRLLELNLRHVQDLISRLGIPCSPNFFGETTRTFLYAPGTQLLSNTALSPMQIEKIVLAADGFRSLYTTSKELEMPHLAIALSIIDALEKSNAVGKVRQVSPQQFSGSPPQSATVSRDFHPGSAPKDDNRQQRRINIEELRRFASKHEQRLLPGIVDPASIRTSYNDIHVAPETIDALKTATTLSLLRPDAFMYGVLAADRLPGLLLYGPPGTGKTLLAKAVAKDASATVLEVSGAQVYEKYVGEGEKMVRAVFSLAKRLSPCVVFIDEADALFGSRGLNSSRNTHREIINQFLREWDGMDNHSVFMMVATNRPFDLDDAVLRRLPRKILVDLPTAKDRESIFKIHLKGEALDESVSLSTLAEQTPFYSGSDLKNVCVAAALAAVKEENELQLKHKEDKEFRLPSKRTLSKAHFDKALLEISASISEDMSSLNAIKKFDEQYGDRRGRRKKPSYGFGNAETKEDESSVRVRGNQDQPRP